jgi:hypothetical protein
MKEEVVYCEYIIWCGVMYFLLVHCSQINHNCFKNRVLFHLLVLSLSTSLFFFFFVLILLWRWKFVYSFILALTIVWVVMWKRLSQENKTHIHEISKHLSNHHTVFCSAWPIHRKGNILISILKRKGFYDFIKVLLHKPCDCKFRNSKFTVETGGY